MVVGIAARLNPVKDIATLVRGFARAHQSCPKLRLLIAGDGEQMDMLKKLSAELGVERQVCFAGWIADTDSFYHAIDINTLTSLSETFPYSLTEGARAALSLAQDPTLREHLGQRLYQRAKADFSLESTLERQLTIYRTILRRQERKKNLRGRRDGALVPTAGATPATTPSWRPLSPSCGRSTRICPSGCSPAIRTTPASPTGSTPSTPSPSPASCGGWARPGSTSTAAAP